MHDPGSDGVLPGSAAPPATEDLSTSKGQLNYTVVIPATGRVNLAALIGTLDAADGPPPAEVIVVRAHPGGAHLRLPATRLSVRQLSPPGHGRLAVRNTGWRAAHAEWVVFLDDDLLAGRNWPHQLATDLAGLASDTAVCAGRIDVEPPSPGRWTGAAERDLFTSQSSCWTAADIAYRHRALVAIGGFDERFHRTHQAGIDLALRLRKAGYRGVGGKRISTRLSRPEGVLTTVRKQNGCADQELLRRKHGHYWRREAGEPPGRTGRHGVTTLLGTAGLGLLAAGRRSAAALTWGMWAAMTAATALHRLPPGPRTGSAVRHAIGTSVLLPPAASAYRLRGRLRHGRPTAVLLDRDDTLIENVPYLADPEQVRPMPGAAQALHTLRDAGVLLGIVTNQSGLARGYFSPAQLEAVHARVDELLGPFQTWQICPHGPDEGCLCRKPAPGMVRSGIAMLGVDPHRCVVIGDIGTDVEAATAAGAHAVLVPTAHTLPREVEQARAHAHVAPNLPTAARMALELV